MKVIFFLHFFEIILGFKKIWEKYFTNFVNYFMEILRTKLFQHDFGKTVVKFPINTFKCRGTRRWETVQTFILRHRVVIKNSKMGTCVKYHQSVLGEFLLCWISYTLISKHSYIINWWVMPPRNRHKIDDVGNTVIYPVLPQQQEG